MKILPETALTYDDVLLSLYDDCRAGPPNPTREES